jgi:hypothetical protein
VADTARASWLPGTRTERSVLAGLLVLAALLRFAPFSAPSYAHDELSALYRLYPTLGETLAKGVIGVDTHPPGAQVLLWAWTKLVGLEERWVKLPFILASIGALLLHFRIAARLADVRVALTATAVLASIQYTVLYGQLARPYALGLFATAWMLDRTLAFIAQGRRGDLPWLAVAAALSAYLHHLALLQAALIGATGLLLAPSHRRGGLLAAACGAVLLYLPNVPLLLDQFGWKGLDEWLAPPDAGWPMDHARFITHWSTAFAAVLGGTVLFALVRGWQRRAFSRDLLMVGLLCGLVPYLITFAYSIWRAPVLQHSVVLFAFPCVLLPLLAGLKGISLRSTVLVAGAIACVATVTLLTTREHFALNDRMHNRYEVIARGIIAANKAGIPALTDAPAHLLRFHLDRWNVPAEQRAHIDLTGMGALAVGERLDGLNADRVFLGVTLQAPEERIRQVRRHFPFLLERHDMAEGQAFILGARPSSQALDDGLFSATLTPQAIAGRGWTSDPRIPVVADTATLVRCWDLADREFGIAFEAWPDSLPVGRNDVVELRLDLAGPAEDVMGVLEVKQDDATLVYRTSPATGTVRIAAACLADVKAPLESLRLRAYVWNPGRRKALVTAATITVRRGNPVRYAWLGPMEGAWTYR